MGQVSAQYGGPTAKLVINRDVRAPRLAKRWGGFSLVIRVCIVGSFQVGMQDVTEGTSSYSPHLGKKNKHVVESLGCQKRLEGHSRGLRQLGIKEAILEGLLVSQGLNFVIGRVSPVIKLSVRHQSFLEVLRTHPIWWSWSCSRLSCHGGGSSPVRSYNVHCQLFMQRSSRVNGLCQQSRGGLVNVSLINRFNMVMGYKSNDRGQGGHSTWSRPPLFMVN